MRLVLKISGIGISLFLVFAYLKSGLKKPAQTADVIRESTFEKAEAKSAILVGHRPANPIGERSHKFIDASSFNRRFRSHVPKWIRVSDQVRVYSAFWDDRVEPARVKVVALGVRKESALPILCHLEYPRSGRVLGVTSTRNVTYEELGDSHDSNYVPIFIHCAPNGHPSTRNRANLAPVRVGISSGIFDHTTNISWIPVLDSFNGRRGPDGKVNLTICVRPLFGNYGNVYEIGEFLAFLTVLGADRFVFYDHRVSDSVKEALGRLQRASSAGLNIALLPWDLGGEEGGRGVWAVGQTAALQDCLYRSAPDSKYVLSLDLDEFVVPRKSAAIPEMIDLLDAPFAGSFVFRHAAFCLEFPSKHEPPSPRQTTFPFLTQYKVFRLKEVGGPGYRVKYLMKPGAVLTAGIHGVTRFLNETFAAVHVPPEMALLQHYRAGTVPCLSANPDTDIVQDTSARRFAPKLFSSRVIQILDEKSPLNI